MEETTKGATFDKKDYGETPLLKGEYEKCLFKNCNFSSADLSGIIFWDCTFNTCDLSMVDFTKTSLRNATFSGCKMLGTRFDSCNKFGLSVVFINCSLDHSSFYQLKLKDTTFTNCRLIETDLAQCDFTNAVFENCDLSGAVFDNTILEHADLRTSYNYTIDPERNKIKKARFSITGISGLLSKYGIEIES